MAMDSTVCPHCTKKFYNSSTRNRHIRNVHCETPINISKKGKNICCPLCIDGNKENLLESYNLLNKHFLDTHNITVKEEKLKFANYEDFKNWTALQQQNANYIKQCVVKSTIDTKIIYLNCNRSNYRGSKSNYEERTEKCGGSIKIDGVCPSRIIARCNINNGNVEVNFFVTHVGHESELRTQQLTVGEQNEIGDKLKSGVSADRIIKDARKIKNNRISRINLLQKQDLPYLLKKFKIIKTRDPDDMVAVAMKVQEWNSTGDNYAFLYKKIGEPHPKLESSDFALGFMNKSMKRKLLDYSTIICMDGTHGTNVKKFELTVMMVRDNKDVGFPVAFLITNRQDQAIQEIFLEAFKDHIGEEIKPKFLMSDDDKKYHSAWVKIMGNTPRRLLCAWHVTKNWNTQGNKKIINPNLRNSMGDDLKRIMEETNEENFWNLKNLYFQKLQAGNETNFLNYLKKYYFINDQRIQMWAYCHRLHAGINTNMVVESFNKLLKDLLNRNTKSTLEQLLDTIDEAVEGKMWKTILDKYRPNAKNYKSRRISKAHRAAKRCNVNEYVEEEEFGKYKVRSLTTGEPNEEAKNLTIVEPSEELLKSNEAIDEFIEEKCEKNVNLQENIDRDTRREIVIQSLESSMNEVVRNARCNYDDANFEKFTLEWKSFISKHNCQVSGKRKMEKQTYFPSKNKKQRTLL